jgi:hypothetical protein
MDDYISREAVLEHYRVTDPAGTFAYCSSILDFVSNIPAADVRPVELIRERIHDALQLLDEINEECGLSRDDYRDLRDTIEGIQLPDLETIMRGYNTK